MSRNLLNFRLLLFYCCARLKWFMARFIFSLHSSTSQESWCLVLRCGSLRLSLCFLIEQWWTLTCSPASGIISFAIVVLNGTKMAADDFPKARCPSCSTPEPVVCQSPFQSNEWRKFAGWHTAACLESLFHLQPRQSWMSRAVYRLLLCSQQRGWTTHDKWPSLPVFCWRSAVRGNSSRARASSVISTSSRWLKGLKLICLQVLTPQAEVGQNEE